MEQGRDSAVRFRIATLDRDLEARLIQHLDRWAQSVCVRCIVTGDQAEEPEKPQILFWDGDDRSSAIPAEENAEDGPVLILISRSHTLAIEMYRYHPVGFLPWSFTAETLKRTMDQCFSVWKTGLKWLDLPSRRDRVRLPLCQLRCVEADGRECILHCSGGQIRASVTLGKLVEELPSPPFFRCQKSFVVHLDAVEKLVGGELILAEDRRAISVGRKQSAQLQKLLAEWTT